MDAVYSALGETLEIADTMRLRGVRLDWRRPVRFVRDALQISLPVLFTVFRRGPSLMATMRIRGFATEAHLSRLGIADVAVLGIAVAAVGGAILARWGPLPAAFLW